jgi:hypothetical protein
MDLCIYDSKKTVKFKVGRIGMFELDFFCMTKRTNYHFKKRLAVIHPKGLPVRIHPHMDFGIHSQS